MKYFIWMFSIVACVILWVTAFIYDGRLGLAGALLIGLLATGCTLLVAWAIWGDIQDMKVKK